MFYKYNVGGEKTLIVQRRREDSWWAWNGNRKKLGRRVQGWDLQSGTQAAQAVWTKKGKRRVVGCFHEKEQENIGSEHKHKDGRRYQDWDHWEEEGSRQWQDEKSRESG